MKLFPVLIVLSCLFAAPVLAQDLTGKEAVDYMLDDGKFSEEEMLMEAGDVFRMCNENPYQDTYFDCKCLSEAFLLEREKVGPFVPQNALYQKLTSSADAVCGNAPVLAGKTYTDCMQFANRYRELETDNPEYCTCVANKVANDFAKAPRLSLDYAALLDYRAKNTCRDPKNRPKTQAAGDTTQQSLPNTVN